MDDQGTGAAPRAQVAAPEQRKQVFLLFGNDQLPEGVEVGDEGVFVIRVVGVTREMVEAQNVAY